MPDFRFICYLVLNCFFILIIVNNDPFLIYKRKGIIFFIELLYWNILRKLFLLITDVWRLEIRIIINLYNVRYLTDYNFLRFYRLKVLYLVFYFHFKHVLAYWDHFTIFPYFYLLNSLSWLNSIKQYFSFKYIYF